MTIYAGEEVSFDVSASDPDGAIPSLTAAPLPVGASFVDHGDGVGHLTWTPAAGQSGVFPVVVTASDGVLTTTQLVLLTVIAAGAPTPTPTVVPERTPTPDEAPTPTPILPPESTPTPENPIPEPATLFLIGLGLLALLARRTRRWVKKP